MTWVKDYEGRWVNIEVQQPLVAVHVYPVCDLEEHDINTLRCWCEPRATIEGDRSILIVHNSKDGRELKEKAGAS